MAFARSRDWCASQARRYKSVAELKDKGDAAFRAGDARAAELKCKSGDLELKLKFH